MDQSSAEVSGLSPGFPLTRGFTAVDSTNSAVRLTPPFIDKIALTIPIPDKAAQAYLIERVERHRRHQAIQQPMRKGGYLQAALIPLASSANLLVQAAPRRAHKRGSAFTRLEFNPSKAGILGLHKLHMITEDLLPNDYVLVARVSRVDVAVDICGAKITELAIHSRRHQKSMIFSGRSGEIETIYLGAKGSATRVTVYDKATQLRETGQTRLAGECTRFEARIRTNVLLSALACLRNPFSSLGVFTCPQAVLGWGPDQHQMFLDSISRRGLHAVLRMLTPGDRKKVLRALERNVASFWDPEKLWAGWSAAVEALGIVPQ